ncbi:oligosaccharide flippase family protein, partial [Chloroflexota bacterium]
MNTIQRIAKNAAALYTAYIVNALLGLFLSILIARMLGDVTFGKYSFALAFTALFAILPAGFNTLLVREVARDKSLAPKYLGNILVIKTILSIFIFGLIVLTIYLMNYPSDTRTAVIIFGIHVGFTALAEVFRMSFYIWEKMEYQALAATAVRLVIFSLGLTVLLLGYDLIQIALVFAIGSVFDLILSFALCAR